MFSLITPEQTSSVSTSARTQVLIKTVAIDSFEAPKRLVIIKESATATQPAQYNLSLRPFSFALKARSS